MNARIEELAKMAYEAHGADEPPPGVFPWSGLPAHEKAAWCRSAALLYAAIMTEAAGVAGEAMQKFEEVADKATTAETIRQMDIRATVAEGIATALHARAKEMNDDTR